MLRFLLPLFITSQFVFSQSIPLDNFRDAVKHWQDQNEKSYERYAPEQSKQIADNILLYQRSNGGWRENTDPLRILTEAEKETLRSEKSKTDTSLDNRNTYPQTEYLSAAFLLHDDPRYREGATRGLRFILDSQLENGGFTHSPPRPDSYRGHITFMDEVMPGTLTTLRKAAAQEDPFTWLPDELANRSARAVEQGTQLILKLQVKIDGTPTVWAGQYDAETLQPAQARSFELPSLVSWESVPVVEYLMATEDPTPETARAIESAVQWFRESKIEGIRVVRQPVEPIRYRYHTADYNPVVVADPNAPPIWARFYSLEDGSPVFATRDGERVPSLADIPHERRTGYSWYGTWPAKLIERDYPRWRETSGL